MKQTKIDLLEPFEKIVEAVLSVPESHKIIGDASHSNREIQPAQRLGKRRTGPGGPAQNSFEGILIHHEGPVRRLAPAYSLHANPVEVTKSLQQKQR